MKSKQLFGILVAISLATAASCLMLIGSGFFPNPSIFEVILGVFLIIALASSKWTYYLLLLPISIAYAIYTPVGLTSSPA